MPEELTAISLKLPPSLLAEIKAYAKANGTNTSAWIRSTLIAALPSSDKPSVDDIKVVDERSRALVKDLIGRVERLEAHCFPD